MKIETALQGSRIQIRDYRKSDLEFLTDMWFDAENGAYLSDPARAYVDETYQHALDTLEDSPHGYYLVIELADTGETIGSCCMFPDEARKVYDIGYCIHKRHWKQGYGSETISLLLRWMQEQGAEKATAEVAVENAASNALLRKFGFEIEKRSEFKKYHMEVRFDSYLYAKALP